MKLLTRVSSRELTLNAVNLAWTQLQRISCTSISAIVISARRSSVQGNSSVGFSVSIHRVEALHAAVAQMHFLARIMADLDWSLASTPFSTSSPGPRGNHAQLELPPLSNVWKTVHYLRRVQYFKACISFISAHTVFLPSSAGVFFAIA
jgi:hypothetical protein